MNKGITLLCKCGSLRLCSAHVPARLCGHSPNTARWPLAHAGTLRKSYAHWVTLESLVWRIPGQDSDGRARSFKLHASSTGALGLDDSGVSGADWSVPLEFEGSKVAGDVAARFPHLYGCSTLKVNGYYDVCVARGI